MDEEQYVNFYRCPDDGAVWLMAWSCMCNDRCPRCNSEIEPYRSEGLLDLARPDDAPEANSA